MTNATPWIVVAVVLAVVSLAVVAALATTWRRRVEGRDFEVEVAM